MFEKQKLSSILDSKITKSMNVNKILYLKTDIFQTKTITTFRYGFQFQFQLKRYITLTLTEKRSNND